MKVKKWSLGGIIILILGLIVAAKQGNSLWKLAKAGERVKEAHVELEQAEVENAELNKTLAKVDSPNFVEKEARDKLGLGHEGETVLILPDQNKALDSKLKENTQESTWKQWWDLYIRL